MRFHHVGISVSDLGRSMAFYRDMLRMDVAHEPFELSGPDVERVMGVQDLKVRQGVMKKGNLILEVFEFASPAPVPQDADYSVANHGISHFGVDIDDLDEAYEHMVANGVRFHSPVTTFPGGIKATYGRDPDGNVFELLEIPASRRD
jgi:catechol 2,3-dioxygenase-like lactoylglutathione lyase family enzyme